MTSRPTPARESGSVESGPAANLPAYVALCCGLASLIPWVILLTLPMAILLGGYGLLRSLRLPERTGRKAALLGIGIGLAAALLQLSLAGLAAAIGWLIG